MKNRVNRVTDLIPIQRVLLSVSDKTGIEDFVQGLMNINPRIEFYSTGGTYQAIRETLGKNGETNLIEVSRYTGQPETQGGLVKTLDFKIYLGILTEEFNDSHNQDLARTGAIQFDMVVVNLYPFQETISQEGSDLEDARGNIDIGGPTMVRASAKNFLRVASVIDPNDYPKILGDLRTLNGCLNLKTRFEFAQKAFHHTADYDASISRYLFSQVGESLNIYNKP